MQPQGFCRARGSSPCFDGWAWARAGGRSEVSAAGPPSGRDCKGIRVTKERAQGERLGTHTCLTRRE
eukprot:4818766-Alexandrium_andersonii.AAC.1